MASIREIDDGVSILSPNCADHRATLRSDQRSALNSVLITADDLNRHGGSVEQSIG
jgi:hypothetical protein